MIGPQSNRGNRGIAFTQGGRNLPENDPDAVRRRPEMDTSKDAVAWGAA